MNRDYEKALKERWLNHVDQQAQDIDLSWQHFQPSKLTRKRWYVAAAIAMMVGYAGWQAQQPLQPAVTPTSNPMLLADNYALTALDRRIQQALLRGADESTLADLWQQRAQLTQ